jgi:hypothetical protein
VVQANEQALEVVLTGLLDLRPLDANVFERQALAFDQTGHVVAERRGILEKVFLGLFEGDEHAVLAVSGAVHDELQREQRLAAARPAAHQGRPALRKAAAADLVEAVDTGGDFRQR